jgi:hypothetical protein
MSERRSTAAQQAAKAAAAKRTVARRKPTAKGGSKPAGSGSGSAKSAAAAAGGRSADAAEPCAPRSPLSAPDAERQPQDRGVRRAIFLAELAEAKELRRRVAPRRARAAELHARVLRTFRY